MSVDQGHPGKGGMPRRARAILTVVALACLFAVYAGLRWSSEAPAFEKARQVADTAAYLRIAGGALSAPEFWINTRPFLFPLVLKGFKGDLAAVASFQTGFSILSWGLLALAVAYSMKSALLRPFAFSLLLAFSLDRHIAGWDVVMLTESLALSLLALLLAAWFWLLMGWRWWKAVLLALVAFLWTFTRDTNAWILLMVAGLLVVAVFALGAKKRMLSLALAFVILFFLSDHTATRGERWVFPFQNVLAERILSDENALSFFSDCGMPVTPELLQLVDGHAGSAERAFYTNPALEPYRAWLHTRGKPCYLRWLAAHPLQSMRQPLADFEALVAFERAENFFPQPYQPLLPWRLERFLYPGQALPWLWGLTSFAAVAALARSAWKMNPAWSVFIGLCLLVYPHLFIVWHGDTSGMDRHALSLGVQFLLGLWLLALLLLDRGLAWFREKDRTL